MSKKFNIEINYTPDMRIRFTKQYEHLFPSQQSRHKLSDGGVDNNNFYELIKKVILDSKWNDVKTDNMFKTYIYGSELKLTYISLSMRYIDYYEEQSFTGKLFYGDEQTDNALLYYEHNNIIYVKSIERDRCHFMGIARGYEYHINE
tara:strand:+ start:173 stop:613 length:441 start_codon:yes stop_codon:yes gene_type:complete